MPPATTLRPLRSLGPLRPLGALRHGAARLTAIAATPLVPSDFVDLVDPLRSTVRLRARVVELRTETRDAVTLVLRPGRGWRGHTAGQYIRIGVDVDGVRCWRAYSLTAPPSADGHLTITVKAIADGTVSEFLVRRARPGLLVQLDQAAGEFVLPRPRPARALFVTAGSGITPVMGMLREAAGGLADAVVVHCAPNPAEVVFGAELRAMAARGELRLVEWHSDTAGLLEPAALQALVPDLAEREAWACGPTALLDSLEAHWAALGVADRLHTEQFRPASGITGEGGTVTFARSARTAQGAGVTPLLEVGEDAGVLMPSGCRMGICFGCVAPLQDGAVRDLRTGALTSAEPGGHVLVQTCVSAAAGACTLGL